MMATLVLYDPTAPRRTGGEQTVGRTLAGLSGAVIGFIDNAKPNFNHLVDDLSELLTTRYGASRILKRRKRAASVPAPDEMMAALAKECDLIITGSGD
jgi:hypothetical protein